MLRFAIAFALMRARKLVRGLRHELSEDECFLVADDVVHPMSVVSGLSDIVTTWR